MKDVIVIPTYNERENIRALIPLIFSHVPGSWVLVADDNSPDGTAAAVKDLQNKFTRLELVSRQTKDGLGKAYLNAFAKVLEDADVRTLTMMDADLSHDPAYLPEMFRGSHQFGVVTGSRYVSGGSVIGWELWRRLLSFGGNLYCRTITGLPVRDCTGGFNTINADQLRKLDFNRVTMFGYAFIFELKYLLYKQGATFKEIPICFKNRTIGTSKMSGGIIREGIIAPWKLRLR